MPCHFAIARSCHVTAKCSGNHVTQQDPQLIRKLQWKLMLQPGYYKKKSQLTWTPYHKFLQKYVLILQEYVISRPALHNRGLKTGLWAWWKPISYILSVMFHVMAWWVKPRIRQSGECADCPIQVSLTYHTVSQSSEGLAPFFLTHGHDASIRNKNVECAQYVLITKLR